MAELWQMLIEFAPLLRWVLVSVYLLLLALIGIYGLHRYWLVWLCRRHRDASRPQPVSAALPSVTVQLPMYNESPVAQRVIDAACQLDYPADLLDIQVLDDSTDDCRRIAADRVAYWRSQGIQIRHLPRADRQGYKAGALAAGLATAAGELIAIFDADFVPGPHFLREAVVPFADAAVGMVQARWTHLNAGDSLLTRSQAIYLDGHFLIEQAARCRSGRWINFNGTAGVWRRQAIDAAGGWQSDTLTEDMDLSYRAQLAGWRFIYLPTLTCPAELPPTVPAFKSQQHRWTKGSIQTARKLLPMVLRSPAPMGVKIEAFFHLTSPMVYLYISLLALLMFPAIKLSGMTWLSAVWAAALLLTGTIAASTFYIASQRAQGRSILATIAQLPALMGIGVGIAFSNAVGVIEALAGQPSPFVRTPKYNGRSRITPGHKWNWMTAAELTMAAYMLLCVYLSLQAGRTMPSTPFLLLFAVGYLYVGLQSLWPGRLRPGKSRKLVDPAEPGQTVESGESAGPDHLPRLPRAPAAGI